MRMKRSPQRSHDSICIIKKSVRQKHEATQSFRQPMTKAAARSKQKSTEKYKKPQECVAAQKNHARYKKQKKRHRQKTPQ